MSLAATTEQVNWQEWSRRWDAQQTYLVVRREERFRVMLSIARQVLGRAPLRVLDLACGTGDVARRVLREFPQAHVVGLDADPLLLAIASGAHGDAAGRLRWVRADLRDPEWPNALRAFAGFELVVSSTALHWLPNPALQSVYRALHELVAPGGLVLNADVMPPLPAGKLASAADALRAAAAREAQDGSGERYAEWWDAVKREPALAQLCRERASLFEDHPDDLELPSADLHVSTLREAGFAEAGVMWRFFDYSVVAAVRAG
jgi:SAM-dependent methyltransferase